MSRSSELLRKTPIGTLGIVGLCSSLHLLQLILDLPISQLSLCPRLVLYAAQWYRIVTSGLFHSGYFHIVMNMLATMSIGASLEKRIGTLQYTLTILWSLLLTSVFYILAAIFSSLTIQSDQLMNQHSVGFSGVLFHLLVLESNIGSQSSRSTFGFDVPTYLYPWALLFISQFMMPNVSFMGHLSGILVGFSQLYGLLDCVMTNDDYLGDMENWRTLQWLTGQPNFVSRPIESSENGLRRNVGSFVSALLSGTQTLGRFVCHLLEAIKVIIFGRGRVVNANIQLSSLLGSSNVATSDDMDDDDWTGLPPAPREQTLV